MSTENILETLRETSKRISDLKSFNIPVILKTIAEYEESGVEEYFIEQQRIQLQKVYNRISELEAKAERLLGRL